MPGRLIVLEGAEGVGKTTQAARLRAVLEAAGHEAVLVREPGGTALGEGIRRILLDGQAMAPAAEALLFMASRAELVHDVIRPALARGAAVIADRFFLSTYAYQCGGRRLAEPLVRQANALAVAGVVPDLTLLLLLPPETGLARAAGRGAADRMEREDARFHARVTEAFTRAAEPRWQQAHPECGPIVPVPADASEDEVATRVLAAVASRFPELVPGAARAEAR